MKRLYILMNCDLEDMNPGKGMAQAAHAASVFEFGMRTSRGHTKEYNEWAGSRGFGTKIVLASNKKEISLIVRRAKKNGYDASTVVDPSYPSVIDDVVKIYKSCQDGKAYIIGPKIKKVRRMTCGFVFAENECKLLEGLELYE